MDSALSGFLMVLNRVCPFFAAALALAAAAGSAVAQDSPIRLSAATLEVEMQGHKLTLPRPSWSLGKAGELDSETYRKVHAEGVELIELIPAGDSFDSWTRMSAALVVVQPGYSAKMHMASVVDAFVAGCKPEALAFGTELPATDGRPAILVAACGEFNPGPVGTAPGRGEIMLLAIAENASGAVKVYEEWRGPAFDLKDDSTWPVEIGEYRARAAALQSSVRFELLP